MANGRSILISVTQGQRESRRFPTHTCRSHLALFTSAVPRESSHPVGRRDQMTWAHRLKRPLNIAMEACPAVGQCGSSCIEDPEVIEKILTHLDAKDATAEATRQPPCRAPPQTDIFH